MDNENKSAKITIIILFVIAVLFVLLNYKIEHIDQMPVTPLPKPYVINGKLLLHKEKIVSLHYDEDIFGNFYIGGGYINNICYYRYMEKNGKLFSMKQVECNKTVIIENNNKNPQIQTWYDGKIEIDDVKNIKKPLCGYCKIYERCVIIVPKGTVIKQFKLD